MSVKSLIVFGLIGLSGYALVRKTPPVPPGSTPADSIAIAQAGVGGRFKYGVGSLGSSLVGKSVRNMVDESSTTLTDMQAAIKNAKGPDAVRARTYAKRVAEMNKAALSDLEYGHPIRALKTSMEAKSLLNAVRQQITRR